MFFCRVDMAGNITKRYSATRLQFARLTAEHIRFGSFTTRSRVPDRILLQLGGAPGRLALLVDGG